MTIDSEGTLRSQERSASAVSERPGTIAPPEYSADIIDIMGPVNLHEFEDVVKKKINELAGDSGYRVARDLGR